MEDDQCLFSEQKPEGSNMVTTDSDEKGESSFPCTAELHPWQCSFQVLGQTNLYLFLCHQLQLLLTMKKTNILVT